MQTTQATEDKKDFWSRALLVWTAFTTFKYFEATKNIYGGIIDLIGFLVDKTSDQGADIAIRALPFISPIPNAISMYYVSQDALEFGDTQAKAVAIGMELILFGCFELTIRMFDGYLKNKSRYKWPFYISIIIALGVMALIMWFINHIETKHNVLAILPLFSAASATGLFLRRWHIQQLEELQTEKLSEVITRERDLLLEEVTILKDLLAQKQSISVLPLQEQLPLPRRKSEIKEVKPVLIADPKIGIPGGKKTDTTEDKITDTIEDTAPVKNGDTKSALFTMLRDYDGKPLSEFNQSQAATRLGITPGTLNYHLKGLQEKGLVTINGTIKINS